MAGKPRFNKKQIIKENIEYIDRLRQTMLDIYNGESETAACKKNDIDKITFRHLLARPKLGFKSAYDLKPEDYDTVKDLFKSWQEILFETVTKNIFSDTPPDINESVDYVLENRLTEQEQNVMLGIYRDNRTYIEICNDMNITAERVRQIRALAERKLRTNDRLNIMRYGLANYKKIKTHIELERLDNMINMANHNPPRRQRIEKPDKDSILNLDIPGRIILACKRAGYHHIYDLKDLTYADIMNIKGIGEKGAEKLISVLKNYNIIIEKNIQEILQSS